ncbi:hypothetical protein V6N13_079483 [Hibiscus sabdariffa]
MDLYIKMAIGNAPWPIGVTVVGIHERSAREKIYTNSVAHIMNDETTRKYLQSVKRLMTFCRRRYPTVPSKAVEFTVKMVLRVPREWRARSLDHVVLTIVYLECRTVVKDPIEEFGNLGDLIVELEEQSSMTSGARKAPKIHLKG